MTAGTCRSRTPASQIASTARPNASGGKSSPRRRGSSTRTPCAFARCAPRRRLRRSAPPTGRRLRTTPPRSAPSAHNRSLRAGARPSPRPRSSSLRRPSRRRAQPPLRPSCWRRRRARSRAPQLEEDLCPRRRIGAHEIELQRIRRAEALDHADRHRKERKIGRDRRLRRDAGDLNWLRMTTIIGASAMIGTVWVATIHGIIERSSQRIETIRTARPMPKAEPMAKPISVSSSVMTHDRRGCASTSAEWRGRACRVRSRPDAAPAASAAPY